MRAFFFAKILHAHQAPSLEKSPVTTSALSLAKNDFELLECNVAADCGTCSRRITNCDFWFALRIHHDFK